MPCFFALVKARTFGESRLLKQTREHARRGWCQSQRLTCCRSNKLLFRIFTNARYVPRMLSTVRCGVEDRACFTFDERWRRSPRDRRCGDPDHNHQCMTKSLRDAGHSHCLQFPIASSPQHGRGHRGRAITSRVKKDSRGRLELDLSGYGAASRKCAV
jgi:hypothetical protein